MRVCKICKQELTEESFYLNRGKYRLHTCRKCISKRETARTLQKRKIKFSKDWYRRRFYMLKQNAKRRNKEFELTFEQFLNVRPYKGEKCFYCSTIYEPFSIERLDNKKGYNISNCVVACLRCNKIKSDDFTMEEMKILGKALNKIDRIRIL